MILEGRAPSRPQIETFSAEPILHKVLLSPFTVCISVNMPSRTSGVQPVLKRENIRMCILLACQTVVLERVYHSRFFAKARPDPDLR